MLKTTLMTAALLAGISAQALAANQIWNVTEEGASGIKSAQGTWDVNVEADKISGSATMQMNNGNPLSYTIDGSIKDSEYTVSFSKRTDDKSGCVWTGHSPAHEGAASHGLIGKVVCESGGAFTVRTGF